MAKTYPEDWRELEHGAAAARELETLHGLSEGLSAAYTVYHAVHWSSLETGHSIYGAIDFVIVNRSGDCLLIEHKSGLLDETADGLVKRYPARSRSVAVHIRRNLEALARKLGDKLKPEAVSLEYLLYCPDYTVRSPETAGIEPARIVDAPRRAHLLACIGEILPEGEAMPRAQKVHRFLRDLLQLETDVGALVGRARSLVTRVSGGLAHWARQLEFEPFRLRVTGTAGSGKTQLALAEYRATLEAGRRPLYVCYNRPLADHFQAIAPPGGRICSVHILCDQLLPAHGQTPDFRAAGAFERLVEDAGRLALPEDFLCDTLIVDEGQDFSAYWRDLVLRHARPGARLLWLEDPLQNLYGRPPVELPGWVGLRARANYRSPRAIVRMLEALLPESEGIAARSPFERSEIDFLRYGDPAAMLSRVREALRTCYAAGFRAEEVVLLSFRGREHSALLHLDALGTQRLRRFTGDYDLLGAPVFSAGELLVESVYRFKGQSAAAIILAEVDFEALDQRALRKLFVGATRATMKLVVVLSERAAAQLAAAGCADAAR